MLHRGDGALVERRLNAIADLYDEAYADPPYRGEPLFSRDRFLERTGRQRNNPGLTLVTADAGEALAGFAFGFTFERGRWWGGITTPSPPDALVAAAAFAVIELVVGRSWRGHGVARRMMDELLRERPEPYAILLAEPDAPAREIYDRWGWQHVADVRPADDAPAMHALALPLT